jgi:hypothetical protein
MSAPIRNDQWHPIDEAIFANQKLSAVVQIRDIAGSGLHESIDTMIARYGELRAKFPERFSCDHDKYWGGLPPQIGR